MAKTDLNAITTDGTLRNWFIHGIKAYDSTGTLKTLREGDFVYDPSGVRRPLLRTDPLPFSLLTNSGNMTARFTYNDKLLYQSPKIVGIGSSTMAGVGLSSPNRYEDKINAWETANTTTPTNIVNLGLGGQDSNALMPTANGGTVGRNIDTALTYNPTFILLDEPTNWAQSYDADAQLAKWTTIFNYALAKGVIVLFNGPRPRTSLTTPQKALLVDLYNKIKTHPLKYFINNDFPIYVQPSTTADLRADLDQGDGTHMNAAGQTILTTNSTAWWVKSLIVNTAYTNFEIHRSTDNVTYSVWDTVTDLTLAQKTYTLTSGYYKSRGTLKDGTFTTFGSVYPISVNIPPTANAGSDQTLTAGATTATLSGSGSDSDGTIASYAWTQVSGPNTASITSSSSASTGLTGLIPGTYVFRLTVTDNLGATGFDDVQIVASASVSINRVLIDLGGDGIVDGGQTDGGVMTPSNAAAAGAIPGQAADTNWWNQIVSCVAGSGADFPGTTYPITINRSTLVNTLNIAQTGLAIRLDKAPRNTFSAIDYSMNYGGSVSAVSDYPVSAVRDNLYVHTSAGIVTITFDIPVGKTASIKFWGNRDAAGPRILQLRKAGDTTWLEYDATTNTTYTNAVTFAGITGTQGIEMQVKSGSTFGHISVLDITLT